jgi:hypothetical protein
MERLCRRDVAGGEFLWPKMDSANFELRLSEKTQHDAAVQLAVTCWAVTVY